MSHVTWLLGKITHLRSDSFSEILNKLLKWGSGAPAAECSLASAMNSKDLLLSKVELPVSRLYERWLGKVITGVFDKRFWPEEGKAYKCAKSLDQKVPGDVLPGCKFEEGANSAETLKNICDGMKNVLEWTNQGCSEKTKGSNRAIRSMKGLNKLCANMKRRFPHKPTPPKNTCAYDGDNKICDNSGKCGLSNFGSCVQLEVTHLCFFKTFYLIM